MKSLLQNDAVVEMLAIAAALGIEADVSSSHLMESINLSEPLPLKGIEGALVQFISIANWAPDAIVLRYNDGWVSEIDYEFITFEPLCDLISPTPRGKSEKRLLHLAGWESAGAMDMFRASILCDAGQVSVAFSVHAEFKWKSSSPGDVPLVPKALQDMVELRLRQSLEVYGSLLTAFGYPIPWLYPRVLDHTDKHTLIEN